MSCHAITRQEVGKEIKGFFFIPTAFNAVFTNNNASGRYGPPTQGSHYTGQDHDGHSTAVFNNGLCLTVVNTE